ncbi:MAG TPA: MarR family transcriptional regulator [Miltoncostaea sp.]|nr:MarR family transcriptional regulator [Miltoncostaea sp.]
MRPEGRPIGRTLAMTAKAVGQAFNAALAAEGGSAPVWLAQHALTQGRSSTQLELARALRIEGPTMARHLDNMERAGYIVRTRSETDRRAVRVELTDAGRAAHERMRGAVIAFDRRLRDGLSRDDVRRLEETLTRLAENVGVVPSREGVVHKAS